MTFVRRRSLGHTITALVAGLAWTLELQPAQASTLSSTELAATAAVSTAVVQGVVQKSENIVDTNGVPWTLYSLEVQKVLAGEVAGKILGFYCLGGTRGDQVVMLTGAPRLTVGDTIVSFLHTGSPCQVSGLEFGIFWKRKDSSGVERLVDFRGRVLAAVGGEDIVLSAATIPLTKGGTVPEVHTTNADTEQLPAPDTRPPAAEADAIVDELVAFCAAYVTKPGLLASVVDAAGLPKFNNGQAATGNAPEVSK